MDGKGKIQALDRIQAGPPLKKGRCGTLTHDRTRHGTTSLFAALNVPYDTIIGRCMQPHRHRESIRFSDLVQAEVPVGGLVPAMLDNYIARKHPKVMKWLARQPRWTFQFTPMSAAWINAVESCFAKLAKWRLKHSMFHSVVSAPGRHPPLPARRNPRPFRRVKGPNTIIAAVKRGQHALDSLHW